MSADDRSELRLEGINLALQFDGADRSARLLTMPLSWLASSGVSWPSATLLRRSVRASAQSWAVFSGRKENGSVLLGGGSPCRSRGEQH